MKAKIHPEFHKNAVTICACGAKYEIPNTKKEVHVEVCSACHPFYTGNDRILDTEGRVEKFKKKFKL
jgi:large subunit ribosomal protein L31